MASQDAFKEMDHSHPIEHVPRSSRSIDQSTGEATINEQSSTEVDGQVIEDTVEAETRAEGGLEIEGDIRFATDSQLDIGGELIVYHDDNKNTSTRYRIVALRHRHDFISKLTDNHRYHYELEKVNRGEKRD